VSVPVYAIWINSSTESVVKFMGIVKVVISFVKYNPQVYLNFTRKSTEGWSLENVLLDLLGGTLTFVQIVLDKWDSGESSNLFTTGLNTAKFLLGIITIVYDLVFLFQHYVLYNPKDKKRRDR
jgi:cystinosin